MTKHFTPCLLNFDLHTQLTCASSSFYLFTPSSGPAALITGTHGRTSLTTDRERGEEGSRWGGVFVNEMDRTWQAAEPGSKLWTERDGRPKSASSSRTEPNKSGATAKNRTENSLRVYFRAWGLYAFLSRQFDKLSWKHMLSRADCRFSYRMLSQRQE